MAQALGVRSDAVGAARQKLAQRLHQATWSGAGATRFRYDAEGLDRRIAEDADDLRRLMTSFQRLSEALEEELAQLRRIEDQVRTWLARNPTLPPPWPPTALPPPGDPEWRDVQRAFAAYGAILPEPDRMLLEDDLVPSVVSYPGDFGEWLDEAQRIAGFSDEDKAALYRLGLGESGGQNIPQGIHDINTDLGTPAFGPMQVIEPTFKAYALEGHDDWHNPVHNIIASYRYQLDVYGSLRTTPGY